MASKAIKYILIILSAIGFLDALFLSYTHFKGIIPPCTTGFQCDVVTTSKYSVLFGVPLAYLGLAFYLTLFIGAIYYLEKDAGLRFLRSFSGLGFLASIYFIYLQGWVINAWCLYCLLSALFTSLFHLLCHVENKRLTGNFY